MFFWTDKRSGKVSNKISGRKGHLANAARGYLIALRRFQHALHDAVHSLARFDSRRATRAGVDSLSGSLFGERVRLLFQPRDDTFDALLRFARLRLEFFRQLLARCVFSLLQRHFALSHTFAFGLE